MFYHLIVKLYLIGNSSSEEENEISQNGSDRKM